MPAHPGSLQVGDSLTLLLCEGAPQSGGVWWKGLEGALPSPAARPWESRTCEEPTVPPWVLGWFPAVVNSGLLVRGRCCMSSSLSMPCVVAARPGPGLKGAGGQAVDHGQSQAGPRSVRFQSWAFQEVRTFYLTGDSEADI